MLKHYCADTGAVFLFKEWNPACNGKINYPPHPSFAYRPIQTQARIVSHIDINGTGLYDELRINVNQERLCKGFNPSKNQLTHFFNLAKVSTSRGTLLHEYYSPCLATGIIKFKDGASGRWTVQSSGLAFVSYDHGESATFFYKDNQWTDLYACSYGMSGEEDC